MRERLAAAGALVGASDHGANKSLYAVDPDGLEFEVMWLVPAEHWGEAEHEAIVAPLDIAGSAPVRGARGGPVTVTGNGTGDGASASTFDPINRQTVSAEIRRRLADAIHTGQLAPGTPLPAERVLCQEFGVARTSVREAIQGLVIAGYVERRGNRSVVAERLPEVNFAGDDRKALVTQLFEVRQVIEPAIVEMAARRATDEQRAEIAAHRRASRRACSRSSATIDKQFHAALARSCGNPLLNEVHAKALAALFGSGELAAAALRRGQPGRGRRHHQLVAGRPLGDRRRRRQGPLPQGGRRGGRPPRRRRAPDGGATAVSGRRATPGARDQYCYFFDDDAFVETDRPGSAAGHHRRPAAAVVLAHHRRRRRLVPAPPRRTTSRSASSCAASSTSASATPTTSRRVMLGPGDVYLATTNVWHGDSNFIGDDEHDEVWILDVFAPPRTVTRGDRDDRDRRLAAGRRHRRHVHRRRAARRGVRHGRRRQDAHHADGAARRRAHRRAPAARQGRRAAGRDHRADRARHDAHHQRADRGQDRSRRRRHDDRLRRHAADPQRAPLRHVRPADRVPRAAGAARAGRSRSPSAPTPLGEVVAAPSADRPRRDRRARSRAAERRGGRRVPHQLLRQPGQRASRRRPPAPRARRAGVHLEPRSRRRSASTRG